MHDPPPNPSQHVERIREILVGRQLQQVEDRVRRLEEGLESGRARNEDAATRVREAQSSILKQAEELRREIQRENNLRNSQYQQLTRQLEQASERIQATSAEMQRHDARLERHLSSQLEGISAAMPARIDASVREILHHLQSEIVHWKNQVDRNMQTMRHEGVTRAELKERFARLASAAMEDEPQSEDGFLP